MKPLFLCVLFLFACKSPSEFLTSNEVHWEKVDVVFRDHTKITGRINIQLENSSSMEVTFSRYIQFIREGTTLPEKIDLYNISGYWYKSAYYPLKIVDIHLNGINRLLFVKRLTDENSRIQLYELYHPGIANGGGEIEYTYFLSYPSSNPLEAVNTRSIALLPFFDQKMSLLVADCPDLAQKIRAKNVGYFIPFASLNLKKHPDVLLRIINEYNKCN
jgi:hypothetical protein